jgi:septum formation protein
MRNVILASASPRRKELMTMTGIEFEVIPSTFEENLDIDVPPKELVEYLSFQKAQDVAVKYKDAIVIAADTIVIYKNKIFGKPKDKKDAANTLSTLSGNKHIVMTGYTIFDVENHMRRTHVVSTKVQFKKLSKKQIDEYIATGEPMDKAGAYGIQGIGSVLIEKIEGDYFNVVGLPVNNLVDDLKRFGINASYVKSQRA